MWLRHLRPQRSDIAARVQAIAVALYSSWFWPVSAALVAKSLGATNAASSRSHRSSFKTASATRETRTGVVPSRWISNKQPLSIATRWRAAVEQQSRVLAFLAPNSLLQQESIGSRSRASSNTTCPSAGVSGQPHSVISNSVNSVCARGRDGASTSSIATTNESEDEDTGEDGHFNSDLEA